MLLKYNAFLVFAREYICPGDGAQLSCHSTSARLSICQLVYTYLAGSMKCIIII